MTGPSPGRLAGTAARARRGLANRVKKLVLDARALGRSLFPLGETILLAGSPRSGTTWVADLLRSAPGYLQLTEPLWNGLRRVRAAGLGDRTYAPPDEARPALARFFEKLLRGRPLFHGWLTDDSLADALRARRLLLKCIRANRLLPWLARNFEMRGILLLVRHPCAVVSSAMMHPGFKPPAGVSELDRAYVEARAPGRAALLDSLGTEAELRALTWALDQHVAFGALREKRVTLLSYEKLLLDGAAEIERVFAALRLPMPAGAAARLDRPSREAHAWSAAHGRASAEERLGGWRKRLTGEQVRRVLAVAGAFGIEGFSEEAVPDFARVGSLTG